MANDPIFEPLKFKSLVLKNRICRSSISGRFDHYNGTGTEARIRWEEKFARGGVAAIISSFVPVHVKGRILPNYAMIDRQETIPFWRELGKRVHEYDCKYIIQLSHGGRQRDVPGIENQREHGLSSTSKSDSFHGLPSAAMSIDQIQQVVTAFADAAARAQEAGLDGIELHASHGYLFTQFLSSAINDRRDKYGGDVDDRAAFLLEVIDAIQRKVGHDFHLQAKINIVDENRIPFFWEKPGNTVEENLKIFRLAEEAGLHALHVSGGTIFPHPLVPPGGFPVDEASLNYGGMESSGTRGFFNLCLFHFRFLRPIFRWLWNRGKRFYPVEGVTAELCKLVKEQTRSQLGNLPVINTGGYQDAKLIRRYIEDGWMDAVAIARPLIANNDLVHRYARGQNVPERPCTFCNRCLINAIKNPLGCYDESRFDTYEDMVREILSVFPDTYEPPFRDGGAP
jgi:2,4-dienoyl-CoA reductase-like NADH-dependent reductase (Old Yellow Enzyme family)